MNTIDEGLPSSVTEVSTAVKDALGIVSGAAEALRGEIAALADEDRALDRDTHTLDTTPPSWSDTTEYQVRCVDQQADKFLTIARYVVDKMKASGRLHAEPMNLLDTTAMSEDPSYLQSALSTLLREQMRELVRALMQEAVPAEAEPSMPLAQRERRREEIAARKAAIAARRRELQDGLRAMQAALGAP